MKTAMMLSVLCLSFLALAHAPQAFGGIGTAVCDTLFSGSGGISALSNTSYVPVLEIAFLIAVTMFSIIGITYGLGTALGIDALKNFSRTEALESFFNLVFIVLLFPGMAIVTGVGTFLANLGQASISPISATSSALPPLSFYALCNNYMNYGVQATLNGVVGLLPSLYSIQSIQSLEIDFMPNGLGFTILPFNGWYPWQQVLNLEVEAYLAVGGIMSSVGIFLFVINFIFPVFLYAGVLLRTFTWTRAAGGSLLALFISFYVIFPALIYPFSTQLAGPTLSFSPTSASTPITLTLAGNNYNSPTTQYGYCFSTSSSDISGCVPGTQPTQNFFADSSNSIPSNTKLSVPAESCSGVSCPYYVIVYVGSTVIANAEIDIQPDGSYVSAANCAQVITASNVQNTAQFACIEGSWAVEQMTGFVSSLSYSVLQVFGVAISFVISFDLLEKFGDLLGAPSLSSGKIMHKVI